VSAPALAALGPIHFPVAADSFAFMRSQGWGPVNADERMRTLTNARERTRTKRRLNKRRDRADHVSVGN
jgi:hypothetical protein